MFSSVRALPSANSAAPAFCSVAWFADFIGTSARSDSSPPFMPVVRLSPFPAGLPVLLAANHEVSRFSCIQFLSVRGVYDYAGPPADSRLRRPVCCLPHLSRRSASRIGVSKIDTQPTDSSRLRFESRLSTRPARLEARWFATPFL